MGSAKKNRLNRIYQLFIKWNQPLKCNGSNLFKPILNCPCHLYGSIYHRIHNWAPHRLVYSKCMLIWKICFILVLSLRSVRQKKDAPCYALNYFLPIPSHSMWKDRAIRKLSRRKSLFSVNRSHVTWRVFFFDEQIAWTKLK